MDRHPGRHRDFQELLPTALFATFLVVMLPALLVFGALPIFVPSPTAPLSVGLGLGVALLVGVAGSAFWQRQAESAEVNFGELMIWSWMRRRNAEERVATNAHLLGVDTSGRPHRGAWLVREKKLDVLYDLTAALESKDPYTHGHSKRVRRNAVATAEQLGLPETLISELDKAAVLHDVGKIRLSDRILRKPGSLTDEERSLVQEHVEIGARMVALVGSAEVVAAVRHHHERWDGTGYPVGLSSSQIPLPARIISVVDAYDAMTTTRPYRSAFGRERAISTLREGAGTQFDPEVVEAFIAILPDRVRVGAGILGLAFVSRVTLWSKHVGASGLASAVASAGLVAIVGASLLPPGAGPLDRALAEPAQTERSNGSGASDKSSASGDSEGTVSEGPETPVRGPRGPEAGRRSLTAEPGATGLMQEPMVLDGGSDGDEGPAAEEPGGEDPGEEPGGDGPGEEPGGEDPGEEPGGGGDPEPPKPPKHENQGRGPRPTEGDPNPDRGQDCPDHSRHC